MKNSMWEAYIQRPNCANVRTAGVRARRAKSREKCENGEKKTKKKKVEESLKAKE